MIIPSWSRALIHVTCGQIFLFWGTVQLWFRRKCILEKHSRLRRSEVETAQSPKPNLSNKPNHWTPDPNAWPITTCPTLCPHVSHKRSRDSNFGHRTAPEDSDIYWFLKFSKNPNKVLEMNSLSELRPESSLTSFLWWHFIQSFDNWMRSLSS